MSLVNSRNNLCRVGNILSGVMLTVNFKKWLCHPVEFKSCLPVILYVPSSAALDFYICHMFFFIEISDMRILKQTGMKLLFNLTCHIKGD